MISLHYGGKFLLLKINHRLWFIVGCPNLSNFTL
nr:MAG TPA_asm: hypothetical protein [Caudoviricetes sp.]